MPRPSAFSTYHITPPTMKVDSSTPAVAMIPMAHLRVISSENSTRSAPANRRKLSIPSIDARWKSICLKVDEACAPIADAVERGRGR